MPRGPDRRNRKAGVYLERRPEHWSYQAACLALVESGVATPHWWWTTEGDRRGRRRGVQLTPINLAAVRVCLGDCQVRDDCLREALAEPEYRDIATIRGGLSQTARTKVRRSVLTIGEASEQAMAECGLT